MLVEEEEEQEEEVLVLPEPARLGRVESNERRQARTVTIMRWTRKTRSRSRMRPGSATRVLLRRFLSFSSVCFKGAFRYSMCSVRTVTTTFLHICPGCRAGRGRS